MTKTNNTPKLIYSVDVTASMNSLNVGEVCEFIIAGDGRHCTYNGVKQAQNRLEKATRKRFTTNMFNNGINMSVKRIK